jgi:hypothetical protein
MTAPGGGTAEAAATSRPCPSSERAGSGRGDPVIHEDQVKPLGDAPVTPSAHARA